MSLNGIDIGRDQAGMNIAATPADFVLIGASDGGAVNPFFHQQYAATKDCGKRRGAYHFFRGNPDAEARFFVANAAEVAGDGQIWCDAETAAPNLPQLVLQWLETVRTLTGAKPAGAYTPADFLFNHGYDWSPVINAGYALWEAAYVLGYQPVTAYNVPGGRKSVPGWEPVMWQYTSSGQLPGWGGSVDLDVFNGDGAAWDALINNVTAQSGTITPILEDELMSALDEPITTQDGGTTTLRTELAWLAKNFADVRALVGAVPGQSADKVLNASILKQGGGTTTPAAEFSWLAQNFRNVPASVWNQNIGAGNAAGVLNHVASQPAGTASVAAVDVDALATKLAATLPPAVIAQLATQLAKL
jgi:lysozyme